MTDFFLGILTAVGLILIFGAIINCVTARVNDQVNAAILDCVLDGVITSEQARQIDIYINRSLTDRISRAREVSKK